ncbi:hypothetical protein M079_3332 [Bacteroides fragilis str. 3996 N(B) 6]|nr:hypothetical protein M079_3332 [Bacteroides fragilis str. 3996 N(B) 6]
MIVFFQLDLLKGKIKHHQIILVFSKLHWDISMVKSFLYDWENNKSV